MRWLVDTLSDPQPDRMIVPSSTVNPRNQMEGPMIVAAVKMPLPSAAAVVWV